MLQLYVCLGWISCFSHQSAGWLGLGINLKYLFWSPQSPKSECPWQKGDFITTKTSVNVSRCGWKYPVVCLELWSAFRNATTFPSTSWCDGRLIIRNSDCNIPLLVQMSTLDVLMFLTFAETLIANIISLQKSSPNQNPTPKNQNQILRFRKAQGSFLKELPICWPPKSQITFSQSIFGRINSLQAD